MMPSLLPAFRALIPFLPKPPAAIQPIDPREQAVLDYLRDQRRQREAASRSEGVR